MTIPHRGATERARDFLIRDLERRLIAAEASATAMAALVATLAPISSVKVVDSASAENTSYGTNAAQTPFDDTIPQSSEGQTVLTATLTPKSASNTIRGSVSGFGSCNIVASLIVSVFRGSGVDAIAVHAVTVPIPNSLVPISFDFTDAPAATTAQTYTVRVGSSGGSFWYLNGNSSGRFFGGAARATLRLDEIAG